MPPRPLDWLGVAVLLGIVLGFLPAGLLGTQRRNRIADRLQNVAVHLVSNRMISLVQSAKRERAR